METKTENSAVMLCQETKIDEWKAERDRQNDKDKWLYQLKYDGERALIYIADGKISKIINRRCANIKHLFPEFFNIVFPFKTGLLDSEIIVENGKIGGDFNEGLAFRSHLKDTEEIEKRSKEFKARIIAFDILFKDGEDLRQKKLNDRIEILRQNIKQDEFISVAEQFSDIETAWNYVLENDLEGLIAKHKEVAYTEKRSRFWIKLKNWHEQEVEFTDFETAYSETGFRKGIVLKDINGLRCSCLGKQSIEVEERLRQDGKVVAVIQYLSKTKDDKLRFISFKELKKENCLLESIGL